MANTPNNPISLGISWLAQLSGIVGFLMWGFAAIFAPMVFSGEDNWRTWFLFITFLSMPITIIVASIVLWLSYQRHSKAIWQVAAFWLFATPWPLILFQ